MYISILFIIIRTLYIANIIHLIFNFDCYLLVVPYVIHVIIFLDMDATV